MSRMLRRDNLPTDATTLVGRRRELDAAAKNLTEARLLTLVGSGGVGKSRLAVAIGQKLKRGFSDGVWLVELAELTKLELLAVTVMHALAPDHVGESEDDLVGFVSDKQLLLILDNCEHLGDAPARLVDQLLRSCPNARVLATSREALRLPAETVYEIPPLSVPPPSAQLTRETARSYESVDLFCERASAAAPWFVLTDDNLEQILALCRRLDGLPLAVELAAMGMRTLTPEQLLHRYDSVYRLLVNGSRAVPPRHQTLLAAVTWSYDLCSPKARELWARLSTFSGGIDLQAVEQVCGYAPLSENEVLPYLAELVEKSVLSFDGTQYRMLETLRQYGRQRLIDAGGAETVDERHFEYVIDLARRVEDSWFGPRQQSILAEVRRNLANIRKALEYCEASSSHHQLAIEVLTNLWSYWIPCGQQREGRHWFNVFLARVEEDSSAIAAARWVNGYLALIEGATQDCFDEVNSGIAVAERMSDRVGLARNLHVRGLMKLLTSDITEALEDLQTAVDLERELGDDNPYLAPPLNSMGAALCYEEQVDAAVTVLSEQIALSQAHGEQWMASWSMLFLGLADWIRKRHDDATARLREALAVKWPLGDLVGSANAIEILAWTALGRGEPAMAARLLGGSRQLFEPLGLHLLGFSRLKSWSDECAADTEKVLGSTKFTKEFESGRAMSTDDLVSTALGNAPRTQSARNDASPLPLTARESEIAGLIARGKTNREIAADLVISQRTVDGHVERILAKLGVTRRTQLAVLFTHQGASEDVDAATPSESPGPAQAEASPKYSAKNAPRRPTAAPT